MERLFSGCSSLISLDLSKFNTTNIRNMEYMFFLCISLVSIDLSSFNISKVTNMNDLFFSCSSLTYLDLTNFNTSKVTDMAGMFSVCSSLTSLDLSNFNTSQVYSMASMFYKCKLIISLKLSNFNTSKVFSMYSMFSGCSSLISLNLSTFNTSRVSDMRSMFYNCENLEYINIKNFNENKLRSNKDYEKIFYYVPENVVICIKESTSENIIFPTINITKCNIIDCSDDWKSKQKKIINNSTCIDSCDNNIIYKYEYKGKCLENCIYGYINDSNNSIINKNECSSNKCILNPPQNIKTTNICSICINNSYYLIENDISNINKYINCYKEPEGYYLDKNDFVFKKCYYTCKTCEEQGNNISHNCLECSENNSFQQHFNNNNYTNCYRKCEYYFYFDNDNKYHCTINSSCPKEYPMLIQFKNECITYDINNMIQNIVKYEREEKNGTKENNREEEIKYYDKI